MYKPLIEAAAIVAICLTGHLVRTAEGDEKEKEPAAKEPVESLDVKTADMFRKLTRAPCEGLLMLGMRTKAAQQRMRGIERMVHYVEVVYALLAPQQPGEPPVADLAKHFQQDAKSAEMDLWVAQRKAKLGQAEPVSQTELQQMALKAELLRLRAEQVSTLAGKSQLDRLEWRVDMLSQELWFLIDRVSELEARR